MSRGQADTENPYQIKSCRLNYPSFKDRMSSHTSCAISSGFFIGHNLMVGKILIGTDTAQVFCRFCRGG